MQIKPISDHILIKPTLDKEKTKGGIFIPETADKSSPEEGIVIAVGPGKRLPSGEKNPIEVKEGDHVLFSKYGPTEIKIEDEKYLIVYADDILAILG